MRDIKDYTEKTNPYELFTHIYWCIINRKITMISELETYLSRVPEGKVKQYTIESAFRLLKEMHWGFFGDLDSQNYPLLWKQLTLPHSKYPGVGELKRSMTITDIYTAFIDIHGYTAFCQTHGNNISMLQLLDNCIENDIRQICCQNQVIGHRARGDEIILVGTSAYDVLNSVIMIADYFGERKITKNTEIVKKRNGQGLKLPRLTISAGIAGGKKYSALVITATGDLSGSVVNTAARLQGRANKIANDRSHILTTNQVVFGYGKDLAIRSRSPIPEDSFVFLDLGPVGFKGVELRLAEVVIEPGQMYRASYQKSLEKIIDTLGRHSWSEQILAALTELIIAVAKAIPPFEIVLPEARKGLLSISNETVIIIMEKIARSFLLENNYLYALEDLRELADILMGIEGYDHAVLLYLETVINGYGRLLEIYEKELKTYCDKNMDKLFGMEEIRQFETAKRSSRVYDMFQMEVKKRVEGEKRRALWKQLAKDREGEIDSIPYLAK